MSIVGNSENTKEYKEANIVGPNSLALDLSPDSKLIWV